MAEHERNSENKELFIPLNTKIDEEKVIVESQPQETAQSHTRYEHGHHSRHHHHHHHHSHHHHKHRKTKKKNQRKKKFFKQFMRKYKKHILYTALAVLFFIVAVVAGIYVDRLMTHQESGDLSSIQQTENSMLIQVPVYDADVSIIGSAATAYLKGEDGVTVHNFYDRYQGVANRLDTGAPVVLSYAIKGAPEGYEVKTARFTVSEEKDAKQSRVIETKEDSASFYNLKTGTAYDYRIDVFFTNGVESSVSGGFSTAAGVRMMKLDGVYNMRDVGGWVTRDGQVVNQGLLYRGCEIDGAVEAKFTITKDGIHTMLNDLGIKTDLDLRSEKDNPYGIDKLGAGVRHTHYDAPMYLEAFDSEKGRENLRRVFSALADKSQYPAYMHCTYGQDRTGTVCYLLGGLLGIDQENLMKDYELTALCHGYVAGDDMNDFVERVNQLPGNTLKEKVEGYLLSIGVTQQEIANLRIIFLK